MLENENTVLISKALTLIFFMSEAERQAKVEIPHDHKDHLMKNMRLKHKRRMDLWDEWHGEGKFEDPHGGIHGRDIKHGNEWRQHTSAHHHSRTKHIV